MGEELAQAVHILRNDVDIDPMTNIGEHDVWGEGNLRLDCTYTEGALCRDEVFLDRGEADSNDG